MADSEILNVLGGTIAVVYRGKVRYYTPMESSPLAQYVAIHRSHLPQKSSIVKMSVNKSHPQHCLNTLNIASQAGALAVVIIDTLQSCSSNFECSCSLGRHSPDAKLGSGDAPSLWKGIYIPAVFVTQRDGDRIKGMLNLENVTIPHHGLQQYVP